MKRKLFPTLFTALLFLGIVFFITSCSDNDDIVETQWDIQDYEVKASEWSWNPSLERWEAVKQMKYISEFIYESGAVIGYVFLGVQNQDEVQTQLPYTRRAYVDDGTYFTETLGYEYSFLTNKVTFYIEPADGIEDPAAKTGYVFRLVLIW
ncbi:MAG: hypothetical protein VB074_12130 [Proteiniphilum sp.]|jgi:hypothetical protein|uniref:hypothetical protein n=1 Tax=Proteiniphilum sp. TaxID=1926877 RepID=UPI002B1F407C|nr:hypothetical protein [Proteiniphilum sp.]MEA5062156.1 hypothetical protein [Petrimonas sp.]MEA5128927.1 hypothetical protein [Proteiniphilum sp.]